MIDPRTAARLNAVSPKEWKEIFNLLVIYAEIRLELIGFTPRSEIDNITGKDIAQESITKICDGSRAWDYERYPDLLIHLKGVAKSLISNHVKKSARAAKVVAKTPTASIIDESEDLESARELLDATDPESLIILEETYKSLEELFSKDEDGFLLFCDWIDGTPPRQIAEANSIEVSKVYQVIKKGKSLLKYILTK